jgi:hypothetical protein
MTKIYASLNFFFSIDNCLSVENRNFANKNLTLQIRKKICIYLFMFKFFLILDNDRLFL